MKGTIAFSIAVLLLIGLFSTAFAAEKEEIPQWFNDMIAWKKARINEAVNNGTITDNQAQLCLDRLNTRVKYVEENGFGFGPGSGRMGFGCKEGFAKGRNAGFNRFGRTVPAQ